MTEGSLPGLISQPSKIFKSYQIQMQNVNFTCITSVLSVNLKVCVLPFIRSVTLRYGHRVYLCAACDAYFQNEKRYSRYAVLSVWVSFFIPKNMLYKIHINNQDCSDMCLYYCLCLMWCSCRYNKKSRSKMNKMNNLKKTAS